MKKKWQFLLFECTKAGNFVVVSVIVTLRMYIATNDLRCIDTYLMLFLLSAKCTLIKMNKQKTVIHKI